MSIRGQHFSANSEKESLGPRPKLFPSFGGEKSAFLLLQGVLSLPFWRQIYWSNFISDSACCLSCGSVLPDIRISSWKCRQKELSESSRVLSGETRLLHSYMLNAAVTLATWQKMQFHPHACGGLQRIKAVCEFKALIGLGEKSGSFWHFIPQNFQTLQNIEKNIWQQKSVYQAQKLSSMQSKSLLVESKNLLSAL